MSSYGSIGQPPEPPARPVLGQPVPGAQEPVEEATDPRLTPTAEPATETDRAGADPAATDQAGTDAGTEARAAAAAQSVAAPQQPPFNPFQATPPERPAGGNVYATGTTASADAAAGLPRRPFPRLRIGSHAVNDSTLTMLRRPGVRTGLVLGVDDGARPVALRLFRPEPTRLALIGGLWAAQLAAFRSLALGARAAVFTSRPEAWQGFVHWACAYQGQIMVWRPGDQVTVPAGAPAPALLVYDEGPSGASHPPGLTAWQTQLTVLNELTSYGFATLQDADLVAAQRLTVEESTAAGSILELPRDTVGKLPMLRDDMLALLDDQGEQYLWLCPTGLEQYRLGAPRR